MTDEFETILKPFRIKIDALDDQIVDLLVQRENIIRDVSNVKYDKNVPAVLQKRVDEVINRTTARAIEQGMDGDYVSEIYTKIVIKSCVLENEIFTQKKTSKITSKEIE